MGKKTVIGKVSLDQLVALAATSISVVFLVAFGGQILEIYRLRSALAMAEQGVARLHDQRAALAATATYVKSDEYAEQVARAELNKIRPGDRRVIIVTRAAPAPTPRPAGAGIAPVASEYLDQWLELLFGK